MSTVVSVPTNAFADKTCAYGPKAAVLPLFSTLFESQPVSDRYRNTNPIETDVYVHGHV
jgi:hypothetical protein